MNDKNSPLPLRWTKVRKKPSLPSIMFVDSGQEKLKVVPTSSVMNFSYHYQDVHRSKQKITELIPGKKVVWHVLDGHLNFVQDKTEWKGTDITFEVSKKGNKTEIRFTHLGLVPELERFKACSNARDSYINGSLQSLITTGKGEPNKKEKRGKRLLYD